MFATVTEIEEEEPECVTLVLLHEDVEEEL
jgi:hypothetical protein